MVFFGARYGIRMLTGYGFTFLIIQSYTLFFTHLAARMGLLLSLFVAGGSALYLVFYLEKTRRKHFELRP